MTTASLGENKMGTMPMNKLFLTMAPPVVLSMSVQALYTMVDSIFVSRISESALTATTLALPIITMIVALGEGIAVGMNAMLSKALGSRNQAAAKDSTAAAIFLAVICYLFTLLLCFSAVGAYLHTQTSSAEVFAGGKTYLSICMGLSFGMFGQVIFERMLISTGKTMYSMITQATGAIINIILDPILIFGYFGLPELGIAGAAIATVIGQIVACILALIFNLKKNKEIEIEFTLAPKGYAIKQVLIVGIPTTLMSAVTSIMFVGYNTILGKFSSTAVAVFGICRSVTTFFYMLIRAFGSVLIPIIAYNFGAKNKTRIDKAIKLGFIYGVSIMAVGTLVFMIFTVPILKLFNASEEMMSIGVVGIRLLTLPFMVVAVKDISGAIMQSLGYATGSMIVTITRHLILLLPLAYLFSLTGNLDLVWISVPIADVLACVVAVVLVMRLYRKEIATLG
ncbi:MAG: MATE family efflux transporter [Clostridiales bacterium]|nr:MATE family efflux transporter [Clostridiales bacterium]